LIDHRYAKGAPGWGEWASLQLGAETIRAGDTDPAAQFKVRGHLPPLETQRHHLMCFRGFPIVTKQYTCIAFRGPNSHKTALQRRHEYGFEDDVD
jgi:hypothetical protein